MYNLSTKMINFDDFKKVELKIGKILEAERVDGSDKLLKLKVDLGEVLESGELKHRQILAGIGKSYNPEDLIGTEVAVVANLEPRKLMGFESEGMLMATSDENGVALMRPERPVPPGSNIS